MEQRKWKMQLKDRKSSKKFCSKKMKIVRHSRDFFFLMHRQKGKPRGRKGSEWKRTWCRSDHTQNVHIGQVTPAGQHMSPRAPEPRPRARVPRGEGQACSRSRPASNDEQQSWSQWFFPRNVRLKAREGRLPAGRSTAPAPNRLGSHPTSPSQARPPSSQLLRDPLLKE